MTLNISASDADSGLAGAPTCTVGTTTLVLKAGNTAGEWTADVSGDGTHNISCSVKDKADNSKDADDTVNIDTTDPSFSNCSVSPSALGLPADNHKLVNITATVQISDSGAHIPFHPRSMMPCGMVRRIRICTRNAGGPGPIGVELWALCVNFSCTVFS